MINKSIFHFRYLIGSILFILCFGNISAQSHTYIVRDLESWTALEANVKITKKFSLSLAESFRLDKNSTEMNQLFTNFEAGYKVHKAITFKTGLRYISQAEDEGENNTNHLRYFLSGAVKYKVSQFSFKHRLMFTNKNELGISKKEGDIRIKNLRLNTKVEYNIKNWKLDPIGSIEIFRRFKDGDADWNKLRFKLGTDINLKKYGDLNIFYGIERELTDNHPLTSYILGLNYAYTFKLYKNAKK